MMKHVLNSILAILKGMKLNILRLILGLNGDKTCDYWREMQIQFNLQQTLRMSE